MSNQSLEQVSFEQNDTKTKWVVIALLILLAITLIVIFFAILQVMNWSTSASQDPGNSGGSFLSKAKDQSSQFARAVKKASQEKSSLEGNSKASDTASNEPEQAAESDSTAKQTGDLSEAGTGRDIQGTGSGDFYVIERVGFFGIASKGKKIVYVVDRSGSMQGEPLTRAKQEVLRSVSELKDGQSFQVIFFDQQMYQFSTVSANGLVKASVENWEALKRWLELFDGGGGTEPMSSILAALAMDPDVVYLLTDGQFESQIANQAKLANSNGTQINTIAFMSDSGKAVLKEIAEQNDGNYLFVK